MKIKLSHFLLGLSILLPGLAMADSITLRNGQHVQGKFAGGTQGVIAFTVGGATQYYEVSNILVMTFEGQESDAQGTTRQEHAPAIVPEPGSIIRQHHQVPNNPAHANVKTIRDLKARQKSSVRLVTVVERSE